MRLLSNLFGRESRQYSEEQEILDEQYLDKDGRAHMDTYLSYFERETSIEASVNEASFADNFISSFFSAPASSDERHWEQAHGPTTYDGGLKTFVVQPGIKRIGVKAFSYNINMKEITLPEGLEIIDREAFSVCPSLSKITIPSTVRFIGKEAFDSKMETLILLCDTPPEISVLGIEKNCSIYVPLTKGDIYKSSSHWRKYARQIRELIQ